MRPNANIDVRKIKLTSLFSLFFALHKRLSEGLPCETYSKAFYQTANATNQSVTHTFTHTQKWHIFFFLSKDRRANAAFARTGETYLGDNDIPCKSGKIVLSPTTDRLMNPSLGGRPGNSQTNDLIISG